MWVTLKEILRGKDSYRILMNKVCSNYSLKGEVFDVGSGVNLASYHRFFKKKEGVKIKALDLGFDKSEEGTNIDLENDQLPVQNNSLDTVLLFNVLEHIYDFRHVLKETKRVLKPGGEVIGSVPFLVGYHPDPHDYWRFTKESLERISKEADFSSAKIITIGKGPFSAALFRLEPILPRVIIILKLPVVRALDWIIYKIKPGIEKDRFALGLFFILKK